MATHRTTDSRHVPSETYDFAGDAGVRGGASNPGLGKAMPHATISLELSSTGLRVASREASGLGLDVVFGIVFIWVPFAA
jgi:hypothetical protein